MKWRIASMAFLIGSLSTGLAWLTLQPALVRLMEAVRRLGPPGGADAELLARVHALLPYALALDLVALTALVYLLLDLMVGRPLRRTERAMKQLGSLSLDSPLPAGGGPLLSRVQAALRNMAAALRAERALTQAQLAEVQAAHARLAQAQTELVSSERLATVGKLAAGVAHEVGNPLAGILGYLSLAKARATGPELKDFLDRIDQEVQRIDQIVRGLLDLGRPTAGSVGPVDVAQLAETCAKLVSAGPGFEGVTLRRDLPPGVLARGDAGPLSQIIINLLLNAAQALGGKGEIHLSARREEDVVRLSVEDDGPGVPDDVMPRIFEPFFTTKAKGQGTGLGLAVSLHLAQRMGGRLTAENRAPRGARFTVHLPAA